MFRTIWTEASSRRSASAESPFNSPRPNPVNPPIKSPVTARRKLSKKCSGSSPVRVKWMPANKTEAGEGRTLLERMPADDKLCHTTSNHAAEGTVTLD